MRLFLLACLLLAGSTFCYGADVTVVVYSSKTCASCVVLKDKLDERHAAYSIRHVQDSSVEFDTLGIVGYPTLIVYLNGTEVKRFLGPTSADLDSIYKKKE